MWMFLLQGATEVSRPLSRSGCPPGRGPISISVGLRGARGAGDLRWVTSRLGAVTSCSCPLAVSSSSASVGRHGALPDGFSPWSVPAGPQEGGSFCPPAAPLGSSRPGTTRDVPSFPQHNLLCRGVPGASPRTMPPSRAGSGQPNKVGKRRGEKAHHMAVLLCPRAEPPYRSKSVQGSDTEHRTQTRSFRISADFKCRPREAGFHSLRAYFLLVRAGRAKPRNLGKQVCLLSHTVCAKSAAFVWGFGTHTAAPFLASPLLRCYRRVLPSIASPDILVTGQRKVSWSREGTLRHLL